jgi:hypothetical protein
MRRYPHIGTIWRADGATLIDREPEATAESSLLVYTMLRAVWPAAKARLSERLVEA